MSNVTIGTPRAVADLASGLVLGTVEIATTPERVFKALASEEITQWWVRPGVFDTTEWTGDLRVGGRWRAAGTARGQPYILEGEFLDVDPPRKLVHTWHPGGMPSVVSTVTYLLEPIPGGTRLMVRHEGITPRDTCANNCLGWETSFAHLQKLLG
jgi:uncharacterized protein YndB with AHSA1/START domain